MTPYPPRPAYPASMPSSYPASQPTATATHATVAHRARPAADYSTPNHDMTAAWVWLSIAAAAMVLLVVGLVRGW